MSSLILVQRLNNFRMDKCLLGEDEELCSQVVELFGSVSTAMMTIFMSTTGGNAWGDVYEVVKKTGVANSVVFVSYIVFFLLAFFNIITSMFVDRALKLAKPDDADVIFERHMEELERAHELRELVETLDKDHDNTISLKEVELAYESS